MLGALGASRLALMEAWFLRGGDFTLKSFCERLNFERKNRCLGVFKQVFSFGFRVFMTCLKVFKRLFDCYRKNWLTDRNLYIYDCFKGFMFGWLFKDKHKELEEKTKEGFHSVRKDFEKTGAWIKHLDARDKQLFDALDALKIDLSSIQDEVEALKEAVSLVNFETKNKQLFKKTAVLHKQTAVEPVYEPVQTPVQTGSLYDILNDLSPNERMIVFTLLNAQDGMKLSYEDLARLLGKERATIRGQINAIKQKSEGLIEEVVEPNGKKRVFIREEVRNKLVKYAKVRVGDSEKPEKKSKKRQKSENRGGIIEDSEETAISGVESED